MALIIRHIPSRFKETKQVTTQDIGEYLIQNDVQMPYVKKTSEGFYDIFDGKSHIYCGKDFALKYLESFEQLGL